MASLFIYLFIILAKGYVSLPVISNSRAAVVFKKWYIFQFLFFVTKNSVAVLSCKLPRNRSVLGNARDDI